MSGKQVSGPGHALQPSVPFRSQLTSISKLDDRILRDIGLNRSELRSAAWDMAAAHGAGY